MKTKKLIAALSLSLIIVAFFYGKAISVNTNSRFIFSKTIKETVLQNKSTHQNKNHTCGVYKNSAASKNSNAGSRVIRNKTNPRICFTVTTSLSPNNSKSLTMDIHVQKLTIICLGRYVVPAANVLLLLF